MDEVLDLAWREGRPPLNGSTLYLEQAIPIPDLLLVVRDVMAFIESRVPNAMLRQLDDWHEHDGVVLESYKTDWSYVKGLLSSVEVFRTGVSDDAHVRLGIYDNDLSFYLRFGYFEAPGQPGLPPETGIMDLSSSDDIVRGVQAVLRPRKTIITSAREYFDERYAGPGEH